MQDCPQAGVQTNCWDGPCSLDFYPNYPESDRLGAYCMPEDETARNKLIEDVKLNTYSDTVEAIDYILIGLAASVFLGLLYLIGNQCFPKVIVWFGFSHAILLLVIVGIVFAVDSNGPLKHVKGWVIAIIIIAIIMIAILHFYFFLHRRRLEYCGVFIEHASQMMKEHCSLFLYIPIFIALTFLFCILIVFQYLAFSSNSDLTYSEDELYPKLSRNFWWMAPLVIETLWGLSFLRDACKNMFILVSFCLGGSGV